MPRGLAAGESQTVLWLRAAQLQEPSLIRWPCPKSGSADSASAQAGGTGQSPALPSLLSLISRQPGLARGARPRCFVTGEEVDGGLTCPATSRLEAGGGAESRQNPGPGAQGRPSGNPPGPAQTPALAPSLGCSSKPRRPPGVLSDSQVAPVHPSCCSPGAALGIQTMGVPGGTQARTSGTGSLCPSPGTSAQASLGLQLTLIALCV